MRSTRASRDGRMASKTTGWPLVAICIDGRTDRGRAAYTEQIGD
jgi:hypothetical protein